MPSDRRKRTRSKIGSLKGPHSRVISCDAGCTGETPGDKSHPGGSVAGREGGATAKAQAGWRASLRAFGAETRRYLLKMWVHRCLGLLLLASCALLLGLCYYASTCESPPPPAGPLTPRPPGPRAAALAGRVCACTFGGTGRTHGTRNLCPGPSSSHFASRSRDLRPCEQASPLLSVQWPNDILLCEYFAFRVSVSHLVGVWLTSRCWLWWLAVPRMSPYKVSRYQFSWACPWE